MSYVLGSRSLAELNGVSPRLVPVVHRAIELTTQDFTVFDGLRTTEEQRQMVASGASQTMNGKHLRQPDGYGHAVDLVPWINGKPRWEWPPIYRIAAAMNQAARERSVALRWGGAWDIAFNTIQPNPDAMRRAVEGYVQRRLRAGKSAHIDGPHYELSAL